MPRMLFLLFLVTLSFNAFSLSLQQLQNELKNHRYHSATSIGQSLLGATPNDANTLFLTALAFQKNDQNDRAARYYQQLIGLYPELPEPRNNLAMIYMKQGKYDEAIDILIATLNTHPAYATAWKNLKSLYQGLASEAYRKALSKEKSPRSVMDKIELTALTQLYQSPVSVRDPFASTKMTVKTKLADAGAMPPQPSPVQKTAAVAAISSDNTHTILPKPEAVTKTIKVATRIKQLPSGLLKKAAITHIENWAKAWRSKNFRSYVNAYLPDYSDGKRNRQAWLDYRRSRILSPGFIRVEIDRFKFKSLSPTRAIVDFHQRFASPNYTDHIVKRLYLTHTSDGWKISREKTLAVL